ncbi:hypothetical protein CEXT_706361, partial [Caerostris extrusa]
DDIFFISGKVYWLGNHCRIICKPVEIGDLKMNLNLHNQYHSTPWLQGLRSIVVVPEGWRDVDRSQSVWKCGGQRWAEE